MNDVVAVTTPLPPVVVDKPEQPSNTDLESSNEIQDEEEPFLPILRPYQQVPAPVLRQPVAPSPLAVRRRNPFFVITPNSLFTPQLPLAGPAAIVRQLPVRRRRRLFRPKFGAKSSGINRSRSQQLGNEIIDNQDDLLVLPSRGRSIEHDQSLPLRKRLLRDGRHIARITPGRGVVIKRRRNKKGQQLPQPTATAAAAGDLSVNYQTSKSFHREFEAADGARSGEYGYIDPIGVRRVVTYATGARGSKGITKGKENDYVGTNTYFNAA